MLTRRNDCQHRCALPLILSRPWDCEGLPRLPLIVLYMTRRRQLLVVDLRSYIARASTAEAQPCLSSAHHRDQHMCRQVHSCDPCWNGSMVILSKDKDTIQLACRCFNLLLVLTRLLIFVYRIALLVLTKALDNRTNWHSDSLGRASAFWHRCIRLGSLCVDQNK